MHEVQTCMRLVLPPPAATRTVWMFGFHRRLVRRWEWDTLWPKPGPLPQTSHTLATGYSWIGRRPPAAWRATVTGYPIRPAAGQPPRMSAPGTRLPDVLDTLDATAVRRWCATGLDGLRRHQREIDELNVYPVHDG